MNSKCWISGMVVAMSLACGGVPLEGPDPTYATYVSKDRRTTIVFTSNKTLRKTWKNMAGPPVEGRFSRSGATIEGTYEAADHHRASAETFVFRGDCTLVRTASIHGETGDREEKLQTFFLDEPGCG